MQTRLGGPEETRTLDLSDANRTLSQLSYRPIRVIYANLLPTIVDTSPALRDWNLPACSPSCATSPYNLLAYYSPNGLQSQEKDMIFSFFFFEESSR